MGVSQIFHCRLADLCGLHAHLQPRRSVLDVFTRTWQLVFSALLALDGSSLRRPRGLRCPAGGVGVVLILNWGIVLDGAQLLPGTWTLWHLTRLTLVLAAAGPDTTRVTSPANPKCDCDMYGHDK